MKILILLLFSQISFASQIKIAVIDTGLDKTQGEIPICKTGSKDFTNTSLHDNYGHGTNVSHLIHKEAIGVDYCQIIIKLWDSRKTKGVNLAGAIEYAIDQGANIINISASGPNPILFERMHVLRGLNKGVKFVVSAGNDGLDLNKRCNNFPACYDPRILVIGNVGTGSNYGDKIVDEIIDGNSKTAGGQTMSGTSQSAAIASGRLIKQLGSERQINGKKEERALRAIAEASYKKFGIEKNINRFVNENRKRHIHPDINKFVDNHFWIFIILRDRRFEYNYEF